MRRSLGRRPVYPGDGHIGRKLVYGRVSDPAKLLAELAQSERLPRLGARHAHIEAGCPGFRFSSPGWANFANRDLALVTSQAILFDLVREKLDAKLPTFAVRLTLFVERYLAAIRQRARDRFGDTDSGLITPDDWIYSAFLPLPDVRIELPAVAPNEESAFVELSALFWTGETAIGVQIDPSASVIGSKRRRLERLRTLWPALQIVEIPRDRLGPDDAGFPFDLFPDALANFWDGVAVPQGPSLSAPLESSLVDQASGAEPGH